MRNPVDSAAYRLAPSGEGEHAATWADKPHRLVYDLCSEVERLQASQADLLAVGQTIAAFQYFAEIYPGAHRKLVAAIAKAETEPTVAGE